MRNPEFVKVNDRKYKINTDYRVALKCEEVAQDEEIGDYERSLAIIYLLYGDIGLDNKDDYDELLRLGVKFLMCGEEPNDDVDTPDMDFSQDYGLIRASFKSDYGIVLDKEEMHWWDFNMYLNGLTEKCVLNRVRELRTYDTSQIKDIKEKDKIEKSKRKVALKTKEPKLTIEQQKSIDTFYELTGIERK